MSWLFARQLGVGLVIGLATGAAGVRAFSRLNFDTPGLYPVASLTVAALAYGGADVLDGSGFLAVYLAGVVLGSAPIPARRTITAFHQGLAWLGQIAVFFTLGLLVFPSQLGHVAGEGLLLAAVLMAAPHARSANLAPFLPYGWAAVGSAASLLFFSFAGWEAVTHLSAEFRDPRRTLPVVTTLALVVVGVLYLGLAVTSVTVLGSTSATSRVPLTLLLASGIGDAARWVTALAAVLLTFGTMNAYIAGASRLGAALGRDGALPGWLARGGGAGEVPRRSLGVLAAATAAVVAAALAAGLTLGQVMLAASACFLAVTLAGLGAAVRLLPRYAPAWWGAVVAFCPMAVVLAFSKLFLAWPIALMLGALTYTRRRPAAQPADQDAVPLLRPAA